MCMHTHTTHVHTYIHQCAHTHTLNMNSVSTHFTGAVRHSRQEAETPKNL